MIIIYYLFFVYFSKRNSADNTKQELETVRQQLQSYQSRINQLESLLLRNISSDTHTLTRHLIPESSMSNSVVEKIRTRNEQQTSELTTVIPLTNDNDESSIDDDNDADSNMIDLTNIHEGSLSPHGFSTQQFSTTKSAIDILHSIIQQTTTLDLPTIKKLKVRKLDDNDDDSEENNDYLVRPLISNNQKNSQRTFNKYGGHTIPITRRISNISFKSKLKTNKSKRPSTKNNHKITTFFDLN